jgi:hypothetical protein
MGMAQIGDGFCFTLEAGTETGIVSEFFRQYFDGHMAIHSSVIGSVDGGHATAPDPLDDTIWPQRHSG